MLVFGVSDVQAITSIVARCPAVLASALSHVTKRVKSSTRAPYEASYAL